MIKDIKEYLKKSKLSICISIIFLFAAYGLMLISSSFSIDSEYYISHHAYQWWNNLGRWGLTLVNKVLYLDNLVLFFNDYFTILNLILFILVMGYLLYLYIHKKYEKIYLKVQFIFPIIFLTSPIFAEQFNFSMQNVAVSLGMLLIPFLFVVYYHVEKLDNKYKYPIYVLGIGITTIIFGIYQSLIVFYIAIVVILYLLKCLNEGNSNFKFLITEISRFLLATIIYYIVCKLTSDGNGYLQTGYSNGLQAVIRNLYYIVLSMLKNETIFYNVGYTIALIILLYIFIKNIIDKNINVGFFLSTIGLLLMPYYIMIATGVDQLKRTQFNYPLFIGFIFLLGTLMLLNDKRRLVKVIGLLCLSLSLGIAYRQALLTATLFQSHEARYNEDIRNVQKIESLIESKDWYEKNKSYKLVLLGRLEPNVKTEYLNGEIIGRSFFEFDYEYYYGVTDRGVIFINILGNNDRRTNRDEFEAAKKYVIEENMDIFPDVDSVQLVDDDTIIIRLSEEM